MKIDLYLFFLPRTDKRFKQTIRAYTLTIITVGKQVQQIICYFFVSETLFEELFFMNNFDKNILCIAFQLLFVKGWKL